MKWNYYMDCQTQFKGESSQSIPNFGKILDPFWGAFWFNVWREIVDYRKLVKVLNDAYQKQDKFISAISGSQMQYRADIKWLFYRSYGFSY